jgi:hypothetical protein
MGTRAVVQPQFDRQLSVQPPSFLSPIVKEAFSSSGHPLDAPTRNFMESGFGHDFSLVRVHTDERASLSAHAINALAFSVGSHVAVRSDQYAPGTIAGRSLLAHELAHVVQQSRGTAGSEPESRAALAARTIMSGQRVDPSVVGSAALGLYRQHDNGDPDEDPLKRFLQSMRPQKKGGMIPVDSPLLTGKKSIFDMYKPQPVPPWVKPGIDPKLPRQKSESEGLGLTFKDWRLTVGKADEGNPSVPGDSPGDYILGKRKLDLSPQGLLEEAVSGGKVEIIKRIIGQKQRNRDRQMKKIEELKAEY